MDCNTAHSFLTSTALMHELGRRRSHCPGTTLSGLPRLRGRPPCRRSNVDAVIATAMCRVEIPDRLRSRIFPGWRRTTAESCPRRR